MDQLRTQEDDQPPPQESLPGAPVFAAIDLGTNNCRLLVARAEHGSFRVIDAFSRIVRLGERVAATGALGEPAMARTIAALRVCAAKLRRRGVTHYRGVATQACREARNGGVFLERVRRETGLALDVIDTREEAELALSGCAALLDAALPRAILFDIGGGSTEVMLVERLTADGHAGWRAIDYVSIPRGVVGYAETHGDVVSRDEYEGMVADVLDLLAPFEARHALAAQIAAGAVQMIGASGTVTTLAGVHLRLARYNRAVVDGSWLELEQVRSASGRIVALDWHGRADHPCIGPERADLVVSGCAILEAICRIWPVGRLRVADRGLREGIILGLMRTASPLPAAP